MHPQLLEHLWVQFFNDIHIDRTITSVAIAIVTGISKKAKDQLSSCKYLIERYNLKEREGDWMIEALPVCIPVRTAKHSCSFTLPRISYVK